MSGYAMVELHATTLAKIQQPPFAGQVTVVSVSPMDDEYFLVSVLSPALPMDCRGVQQLWIDGETVRFKPDCDV